jgi:hypothetical protein
MVNTTLELKGPLTYIYRMTDRAEFQNIFFSLADWFILTQLQRIFQIFVKPSIKLQGEFYTTLPTALLYVYNFYLKLSELRTDYTRLKRRYPEAVSYLFIYYLLIYFIIYFINLLIN